MLPIVKQHHGFTTHDSLSLRSHSPKGRNKNRAIMAANPYKSDGFYRNRLNWPVDFEANDY
jgi:hypothetical protein